MNFHGKAKRLDRMDVPRMAAAIGVGEDELHAFLEVEANGSGFDGYERPKALFEPHVFWRNLPLEKREAAEAQGLAYPKWRRGNYPVDSYPRIHKAMLIDKPAALKATSWGLTQILGENAQAVGYDSVESMVEAFKDDEENHVAAMIRFLVVNGIDDDLRAHRWEVVARVYNGPGYAEHDYHGKLARAYAKWARIADTPFDEAESDMEPDDDLISYPTIREGANGFVVRHLQQELQARGYPTGRVDGQFGTGTKAAVLALQADHGLPTDGVVGPATWAALEAGMPAVLVEGRQDATVAELRDAGSRTVKAADAAQVGGGVAAAVGVLGAVQEALGGAERTGGVLADLVDTLEPLTGLIGGNWQLALLAMGGLVIWSAWRQKTIRLEDHKSGMHRGR